MHLGSVLVRRPVGTKQQRGDIAAKLGALVSSAKQEGTVSALRVAKIAA